MSDTEQDTTLDERDIEAVDGAVRLAVQSNDADIAWSAVAAVVTQGDAYTTTSAVGAVISKSGVGMSQSLAGDVWTRGDVDVDNGAVGFVGAVGDVNFERSAAMATVARSTVISGSKVGFVLSGRTEISDDSRVIMDGKSAAIFGASLGAVLLVAFTALVGWGWWAWRRYEPRFTMPKVHLPHVDMPKLDWRR